LAVVPTEPGAAAPETLALSTRRQAEREDRQRGMNTLQVLLDDARHYPDGTVRITQAKLAALTGMTRGRVQYILRGQTRTAPPLEDLQLLAGHLGLTEEQVQNAAGQVYGWNLYATRTAKMQLLVASATRLNDHQLGAVQALIDALASSPATIQPAEPDPPVEATA
jgi:transcriptional regulator with XRE-family HTH domain